MRRQSYSARVAVGNLTIEATLFGRTGSHWAITNGRRHGFGFSQRLSKSCTLHHETSSGISQSGAFSSCPGLLFSASGGPGLQSIEQEKKGGAPAKQPGHMDPLGGFVAAIIHNPSTYKRTPTAPL